MSDNSKPRRWHSLDEYFTAVQFFLLAVRVWMVATLLVVVGVVPLVHLLIVNLSLGTALLVAFVGGVVAAIAAMAAYLTLLLGPWIE